MGGSFELIQFTRPIDLACIHGDKKEKYHSEVQRLLGSPDYRIEVDVNTPISMLPLGFAAMTGDRKNLERLKGVGAIVDAVVHKESGCTGLILASMVGNRPAVEFFLDSGADPSTKNLRGRTALTVLLKRQKSFRPFSCNDDSELKCAREWMTMASLLYAAGARPEAEDCSVVNDFTTGYKTLHHIADIKHGQFSIEDGKAYWLRELINE